MLNQQQYKMAAPGAGMIAYCREAPRQVTVLLSQRSEKVGAGLGITGGGYLNCDEFMNQPPESRLLFSAEAYRESVEENPGFEKIFSEQGFMRRARQLTAFAVRKDDHHGIHAVCYFGLELTYEEYDEVLALPPGDERVGELIPVTMSWSAESLQNEDALSRIQMDGKDKFYHAHEVYAFVALAERLEHDIS